MPMIQPFVKVLNFISLSHFYVGNHFGKEPFALLSSTSLHSNKRNPPIDGKPNNWGAV